MAGIGDRRHVGWQACGMAGPWDGRHVGRRTGRQVGREPSGMAGMSGKDDSSSTSEKGNRSRSGREQSIYNPDGSHVGGS